MREIASFQMACIDDEENVPLEDLVKHMLTDWEMTPPNLVISLLENSSHSTKMDPYQRDCIKEGLLKAASTSQSWVLTSGLNRGISSALANDVRIMQNEMWVTSTTPSLTSSGSPRDRIRCIGVNKWKTVDNHEEMKSHFERDEHALDFHYVVRKHAATPNTTPLNPSHPFFIFTDTHEDSQEQNQFKSNWNLTQQLLSYLNKHEVNSDTFGGVQSSISQKSIGKVPVVVVVVGGDLLTFRIVLETLREGIPVVVCDGVGGASDCIIYAMKSYSRQEDGGVDIPQDKRDTLKNKIRDISTPNKKGQDDTQFLELILSIVQFENMVTVCKVGKTGTSGELDSAILHAIVQTKNSLDPLELCFNWNRPDTARNDVLTKDMQLSQHKNSSKLMMRALLENKTDFVQLFLDFNFSMKEFLIEERLKFLYNYAIKSNDYLTYIVFQSMKLKTSEGKLLSMKDVSKVLSVLCGLKDKEFRINMPKRGGVCFRTFDDPFGKLFVWSILANKLEMSKFLWGFVREPIAVALVGSEMWRRLSRRLWPGEDVYRPQFIHNSEQFEDLALGAIDTCYKTDHVLSRRLVRQKSLAWPNRHLMQLALHSNCKRFLASSCVQSCVDSDWKGGVNSGYLKVVLCMLFPPLIAYVDVTDNNIESKKPIGAPKQKTGHREMNDDSQPSSSNGLKESEKKPGDASFSEEEKKLIKQDSDRSSTSKEVHDFERDHFQAPKHNSEDDELTSNMGIWRKLWMFYTAPRTKFTVHSAAYFSFLLLFSLMALWIDNDHPHHNLELYMLVVSFSYLIDEMRQFVCESGKLTHKLYSYLSSEWNIIDLTYLPLIAVGFVLNKTGSHDSARIVYGLVTLLMWVRVIRLYQAVDKLGTLWIMMRKMFKEMLIFITVLVVFLLAYGVCTVTLIFKPETLRQEGWASTLEFVILIPSLQMFGELFLDTLVEGREQQRLAFESHKKLEARKAQMRAMDLANDMATNVQRYTPSLFPARCLVQDNYPGNFTLVTSYNNWETNVTFTWSGDNLTRNWATLPVSDESGDEGYPDIFVQDFFQASLANWLLAAYLLVGNVLILNLLIAIFGHVYDVVQENSTIEWKFEMFNLCRECVNKTVLPPPLSIVETIWKLFRAAVNRGHKKSSLPTDEDEDGEEKLRMFENFCSSKFRNEKHSSNTLEENIKQLTNHADEEMDKIVDMVNVVDNLRQDLEPQDSTATLAPSNPPASASNK
ncbi:transient receptor potential cation channel subfamily M member 3-like isoform X2 [Symsagittifera roscoffensis]|uniref:transient receptor potential cation channel subfamily M member 3-like isoform X2 n=1 Tax=Symsagittifera roscoffensis TaxID=84072 RepID=UPI00307C5AA6